MLVLSCTSIASTFTSVRSLRYVIFPVQVLFKSCKPVPVMIFGTMLGKRYPLHKYVNVVVITTGVALFMGGGSSSNNSGGETSLIGAIMLSVSLCFDGATGAYEDKLMGNDHVEPFDLMYNIQFGKAVISFIVIIITNQLSQFNDTINHGGLMLIVLGLTGAMGQVFVFITISKFGALNCALIGLGRKMLSLLLSFVLYGHSMNSLQVVGLTLSLAAMVANFKGKSGGKAGKKAELEADKKEAPPDEKVGLLGDTDNRVLGEMEVGELYSDRPGGSQGRMTPSRSERSDLLDFEVEFEEMDGIAKNSTPHGAVGAAPLVPPSPADNPFDTSGESDPFAGADPFASTNSSPMAGSKGSTDPFEAIQRRIEEKLQSPSGTTTTSGQR